MKEKKKEKDFVLQFSGGIGKHICATSLVRWVSEKYPKRKITVISGFPEIFEYNPRIYRNLTMKQSYLFEDYIQGRDFRLGEPYQLEEYYRDENKMHINSLLPKAYRFEEYNEDPKTEVYLTKGEQNDAMSFMQKGPVVTIQFSGGITQGMAPGPNKPDFAQRDMQFPMAQAIVNILRKKGFRVLQIAQKTEPGLQGVERFNIPFRKFISLCPVIAGHIGIDSSYMHACAVFKTPQLIFWGQTHTDNLGYAYDGVTNIAKPEGMYCRPHTSFVDNAGQGAFRSENEQKAMDFKLEEVEQYVNEFVQKITETRLPKLYPGRFKQVPKQEEVANDGEKVDTKQS